MRVVAGICIKDLALGAEGGSVSSEKGLVSKTRALQLLEAGSLSCNSMLALQELREVRGLSLGTVASGEQRLLP